MARALATPTDVLLGYDPGLVTRGDQAAPLEVRRVSFAEMTGGADTQYEDFMSGLRDFVAARASFGGAARGGADPSALVFGVDFVEPPDEGEADAEGGLSKLIVSTDAEGGLPELIVSTDEGEGLSKLIVSTDSGRAEPPHVPAAAHPAAVPGPAPLRAPPEGPDDSKEVEDITAFIRGAEPLLEEEFVFVEPDEEEAPTFEVRDARTGAPLLPS